MKKVDFTVEDVIRRLMDDAEFRRRLLAFLVELKMILSHDSDQT